jgi:ABC-2 type transport system permease protein
MIGLAKTEVKSIWSKPFEGTGAVFRHELRLLLFAPLSYLFQIVFLIVLAACIFLIADFYNTDEASVQTMLTFLPWVSLILVPALAMRSWLDEHSDRSVELMLTLPVSLGAVVIGKFLAGYVILLVTLLFTLPMVGTLFHLGDPDTGVLFASYLASALMLAVYYAISLFAAALSRDQVGAFVISLAFLFILMLFGWDVFGRLLRGMMPLAVADVLAFYSPNTWLIRLSRGLIDFPGIFYAISVVLMALAAAGTIIRQRYRGVVTVAGVGSVWGKLVVGIIVLGLLIPLSTRVQIGLDLTSEQEFTLHEGTIEVLEKLPPGTTITLYWSAFEASVPPQIKLHVRRISDLLDTLVARSGDRLTVQIIDPQPDTDEELKALASGIKRIPMSSGDYFFLGMTLESDGRRSNIPYLDIRRDRLLEYDIALGLNGLTHTRVPSVGILSPLLPPTAATGNREGMSFMAELRRAYDVAVIPHFNDKLPDSLDVLVLIDATILKRKMLYAIDQFVMRGGRLIVMMDPYLRFNRSSNVINPSPSLEINDISDVLQKYGIKYLGESVVGDAQLASVVSDQQQARMSFPYWMRVTKQGLSQAHPATADLNEVFMVEPGALELLEGVNAKALITTTENSGALARKDFSNKTPSELAQAFKIDEDRRTLAAVLNGPFNSAFSSPPEETRQAQHLKQTNGLAGPIFVIADVDWLFDPFSLQQSNVGGQVVVRPLNDNLAFLLNIIEYASGEQALIAIRSRGKLKRPFTRVAKLFQTAEQKFQERESKLGQQVTEIENRVAQYLKVAETSDNGMSPIEIERELQKFRLELLPARRELRSVRRQIRNEVDQLGRRLTFINIMSGPVLVGVWGLGVMAWRRRTRHIS